MDKSVVFMDELVLPRAVQPFRDGALVADHSGIYYPETPMSINFNLWFISGGLVGQPGDRAYQERVDWVYFAENEVVSPAQVTSRVGGRSRGWRPSPTTTPSTMPRPAGRHSETQHAATTSS